MSSMRAATPILTEPFSILEWTDDALGILASQFCLDHDIQYGAKLHVRDFQQAWFIADGQFADIYNPGLYTLTRENMARLSVLRHLGNHHEGTFQASVFFIKTKFFIHQTWALREIPASGLSAIHGTFDIKIINARKIIQKMAQADIKTYTTGHVQRMLEQVIKRLLPDALKQSQIKSLDELDNNLEVVAFIQESMNIELNNYGLLLRNLTIITDN